MQRNRLPRGPATWRASVSSTTPVSTLTCWGGLGVSFVFFLRQLRREAKQHYVSPFHLAAVYVGLGEDDHAFEMLRQAYEEHSEYLIFVNVSPIFDRLHSAPRFQDLLRRIGLPP